MCRDQTNVEYRRLDVSRDDIPRDFDLIVCGEVLYYVGSRADLARVARRLAHALAQDGRVLMTHANCVVDAPTEPGFTWDVPYGAKTIARVFGSERSLRLEAEVRTPLYRIQLYRRARRLLPGRRARVTELKEQPASLKPGAEEFVHWGGVAAQVESPAAIAPTTSALPILMYHRVVPAGSGSLLRYRITPDEFERQLRYLRETGYRSVPLESWQDALERRQPLAGLAMGLTFDDATIDFAEYAWPLLKRYGYPATLFVPTAYIDEVNAWDSEYSDPAELLSWHQLQELASEGVTIGSHSASHPFLTALPTEEVVREGIRSRLALTQALGQKVNAFAYPYGDHDPVVEHLLGACGYTFGLGVGSVRCTRQHSLLALPRIEVRGDRLFADFVAALELSA